MLPAFLMADPLAPTLLLLAFLWLAAKLGGEAALRLGLPTVAGELGTGLLLGVAARHLSGFPDLAANPAMELLAGLGVVVLMFAVGLESTVGQMAKVGAASLRVALVGVLLPMAAGMGGAYLLLPKGTPILVDLFIGACLCATSIGISAQVLRERGEAAGREGRIIVGAAVLDDVLGLLVLVGVSGAVGAAAASTGAGSPWMPLLRTLGLALLFLLAALGAGSRLTPHLVRLASRLRSEQVLLPFALGFAFLLAWLGTLAGLAAIVGAYAAGLVLEPAHIRTLEERELHSLEQLVRPLVVSLSPLFFVLMGAKVDAVVLLEGRVLLLAGALALLGTLGKLAAGLAAGRGARAGVVGWGMVPRGEVGLIFVAAGGQLRLGGVPLLSPEVQAGIVGALLLTTVAGPLGLSLALRKQATSV